MGREWQRRHEKMKRKIQSLQVKFQPWKTPVQPQIQGVKISDEELAIDEANEAPYVVKVFGGALVPGEAKAALALDPKFALHPKIDLKEVEMEIRLPAIVSTEASLLPAALLARAPRILVENPSTKGIISAMVH